jgi:MFS superfamily sulfate permease-like transporter
MHLDTGEICPMVTRLHNFMRDDTHVGRRRTRSRSLGAYRELHGPPLLQPPILPGLLYGVHKPPDEETLRLPSEDNGTSAVPLHVDESQFTSLDQENPVWISVMYGLINAVIVLPVLMSFGSIIYRDEAFVPYTPVLVKLTVVSGMVHQICFSTFSSLPFAVGQVQDAGLIFLSSMARDIVEYCRKQGHDDETMLATVTVGLGLATFLLGFGLVLVGRLRLAQYVQMLPTCVIGGYLAFIGWFCGMSGLELMAGGGDISLQVFADKFWLLLPGIAGGLLIYVLVRRLQHMAVLPACIAFLFVLFYVVLFARNKTIEQATNDGWIRKSDAPPVWYHTWDYLKLNKVDWSALPGSSLTLLSMIFVVALSSSLDVAAIELELKRPLDYNHELTTVGISNIVSGAFGGYTGSYVS